MKAIVRNSTTPWDMSFRDDLELPSPSGTYLLAKVAYAGICASDLDILKNLNGIYKPPVVQGHEFSAIVEEVGPEVRGFEKGDLITSETTLSIEGVPNAHQLPDYQLMAGKNILGWTVNGGFAEYVLLNANFCHKFSRETDPKIAALSEPMAIAMESVIIKGKVHAEHIVAIIGPGPIGILCALVAKHYVKAKHVLLIGLPSDEKGRLVKASELGIEHRYTTDTITREEIEKLTGGSLADVVIDATGNIKGFRLGLDLVRRNGHIVQAGSITEDTSFSWERAAYLALTLSFVFSSSNNAWKYATDFINSTEVDLKRLISDCYTLREYEDAFKMAQNTSDIIKIMFKPN